MITQKAIILRTIRFGEADLVIHALSQEGEKLKLFARAALKSRKRFGGGVLEPTHYVSLSFKPAKDEEGLASLNEASLIESFMGIRKEYDRIQLALHFVNLIDRLSLEGMPDSKSLFDLLGNAMKELEISSRLSFLKTHFELKLLFFQGVLPGLEGAREFLSKPIRQNSEISIEAKLAQDLEVQAVGLLQHYMN